MCLCSLSHSGQSFLPVCFWKAQTDETFWKYLHQNDTKEWNCFQIFSLKYFMDFLVLPSQIVFLLVFSIIAVREKYTIGKENLIIFWHTARSPVYIHNPTKGLSFSF